MSQHLYQTWVKSLPFDWPTCVPTLRSYWHRRGAISGCSLCHNCFTFCLPFSWIDVVLLEFWAWHSCTFPHNSNLFISGCGLCLNCIRVHRLLGIDVSPKFGVAWLSAYVLSPVALGCGVSQFWLRWEGGYAEHEHWLVIVGGNSNEAKSVRRNKRWFYSGSTRRWYPITARTVDIWRWSKDVWKKQWQAKAKVHGVVGFAGEWSNIRRHTVPAAAIGGRMLSTALMFTSQTLGRSNGNRVGHGMHGTNLQHPNAVRRESEARQHAGKAKVRGKTRERTKTKKMQDSISSLLPSAPLLHHRCSHRRHLPPFQQCNRPSSLHWHLRMDFNQVQSW